MSGLGWVGAAARRGAARLVPAGRRDWVEAVWAEAPEVSPGWRRLHWRVGGVRLVASEALLARRIASTTLFAAAGGFMAWEAWRGSPASFATSVYRVDVITVVAVLAGGALLARRFLGARSDTRTAAFLRFGTYAAILALIPAKDVVEQVLDTRPRGDVDLRLYRLMDGHFGRPWSTEIALLVVVALCAAVVLWVTARRSGVAPATLAIGTGGGVALGLVLYTVGPLGLSTVATDPWLPGADVDPLVVLAWILLLYGPVAAALIAVRRYTASSDSPPTGGAKARQIVAAGLLTNLIGALFFSVAATGTTALMIKAAWLRNWLYHGQHLLFGVDGLRLLLQGHPAALTYSHQLTGALDAPAGPVVLVVFALIALVLTGYIAWCVWGDTLSERDDPRRGGGSAQDSDQPSGPPDGARLAGRPMVASARLPAGAT